MGVLAATAARRWMSVLAGITALVAVPGLIGALPVSASHVDPGQLRARILAAQGPYAGYAESVGSLGLPDLPETGDLAGLFGSLTRMRAWQADGRSRADVLTPTGERGYYTDARGATVWDYELRTVTRLTGQPDLRLPRAADLVPPDLARRLLADSATGNGALSSLPDRRIAGVAAAGIRFSPADPDTTIGAVDVWADPGTGLALEVQVRGGNGAPASLRTRFLDVRQGAGAVDPATVRPPRPDGATRAVAQVPRISELVDRFAPAVLPDSLAGRAPTERAEGGQSLRTYGSGFAMFAAASLPFRLGDRAFDAARSAGAQAIPLAAGSAVLLHSEVMTLLVVLPADERGGFVLAGPVSADVLTRAAEELAGLGAGAPR
jgi:hypothetical protein